MKTKLVIFGITGDLSRRKLLPALTHIIHTNEGRGLEVIGVSRRDVNIAELLEQSVGSVDLASYIRVVTLDLADAASYVRLKQDIDLKDDEQLLVYLSVPPGAAAQIVDFLGEAGINSPNVKILFEKPFGVDLTSAKEFIARTARYYDEAQLYRIDHFLAKEMAQNIVAFRGGNALFSHVWNNNFVEAIDVIAYEKIDIEGRAQFYEQTGALRDLVQGHLMQLLALTLMDIPHDFDWSELPQLRARALEQIEIADPAETVRAQYEGYQEEVDNPGSQTETFVSVGLRSSQPRWLDVPLRLVTGKALSEKTTEVRIRLKKLHEAQANTIVFHINPNEGVSIQFLVKKPGYEREFETRELSFNFPTGERLPDAYEQVLIDAIRSHKSLFTTSDEVLRSWQVLQPIQHAWDMQDTLLRTYKKSENAVNII